MKERPVAHRGERDEAVVEGVQPVPAGLQAVQGRGGD